MKHLFYGLLFILSLSSSSHAHTKNATAVTEQCTLAIYANNGRRPFLMKGLVRLENADVTGESYLTLEPNSSSGFQVSARILLTRFNGEDYFPMSLHLRGDTYRNLVYTEIKTGVGGLLKYNLDNNFYSLECHEIDN